MILDGKAPAEVIKQVARQTVRNMEVPPALAIIQVGDNPASNRYVRNKLKDAEECGIKTVHRRFDEAVTTEEILVYIDELNKDDGINGIIVQLPLPEHLKEDVIINKIAVPKDVDGLTTVAQGMFYTGKPAFVSCTAEGVMRLLNFYNVPIDGQTALVVGRSNLVGAPLARMLQNKGATVTTYHSHTPDIMNATDMPFYDIICYCTGQGHKYSAEDFAQTRDMKHTIIDVGISFDERGKLIGDFNPVDVPDNIDYTPVPGGIGLMTRAVLMDNVVTAACVQEALRKGMI